MKARVRRGRALQAEGVVRAMARGWVQCQMCPWYVENAVGGGEGVWR